MPKPAPGRDFYIATADEIRAGRTTDLYFVRTLDILKKAGRSRANVVAEVTTGALPNEWPWGIFCGLEEVVHLLEGKGVSLWALPEGSVFPPKTHRGIPVPVMILEGPYEEWALYETPVLGMICQASGIATKAARIRKLANGKQVLSFGVRRMHPGLAPLIERSVTIGGLDAITTPLGAELLGVPATGTMPHALVIVMGGPREAFAAVHKYLEAKIPRIALVDTYYDEKTEALMAVEAIPDLLGVRLDTPASRRGNFAAIIREVRWELDLRGHKDVKIFVSGSVDEKTIPALLEAGVDGFGGHELEQRADNRFRPGSRGSRGQAGGKAGQVWGSQRPSALPQGRDVRDRQAHLSHLRHQDGLRLHAVLGPRSGGHAFAIPQRDSGASDARDRAGLARVMSRRDFIVRTPRPQLQWAKRKPTSERHTIGSRNRSRPADGSHGPKSCRSLRHCVGARGFSISGLATDDTRRFSRAGESAPWRWTSHVGF